MTLHLTIITPERELLSEEIEQVTLTTQEGEITILPKHIPLVSILKPGELYYKKAGESYHLALAGGFLEVQSRNKVIILADVAEHAEEINEQEAEQARQRAEKLLSEKAITPQEYTAILEHALARLKVVRKKRSH